MKRRKRRTVPAPAAVSADRRRHERHVCINADALRLAVRPMFRGLRAVIVDVSAGGVGFLLPVPLIAGAVLAVELCGRGGEGLGRLATVRHCRPHPVPADAPWLPQPSPLRQYVRGFLGLPPAAPPGQAWLIGCEFSRPLEQSELDELLSLLAPAPLG